MPNVARLAARRPQRSEPLFLFDARRPIRAANTDMIDQVITHADLCARLAGGRLKLQVSRLMADSLIAQGRLAEDDYRLCDLTVIWDEAEGQVVQVRDDARVRDAAARWAEWDSLWDEDSYAVEDLPQSVAA